MGFERFIKQSRLPTAWCSGCGLGMVLKTMAQAFDELNFSLKDTVVVSGIGCTGRIAGYFNLDTVHGLHGRAIPVAEGIKAVNPKLNVIVISGDGDLLSIGGNHLIHSARRNTDITVICVDNSIYGMTGGQKSPTTPWNVKTLTSPAGNVDKPLNVQGLVSLADNFYARSTCFHLKQFRKCVVQALQHKGFSFVEVKSQCITNYGRRLGYRTGFEMINDFKKQYKLNNHAQILAENEIGVRT